MTLGESIYALKEKEALLRYTDYPTLEQLVLINQILTIIRETETPELVGNNVHIRNSIL